VCQVGHLPELYKDARSKKMYIKKKIEGWKEERNKMMEKDKTVAKSN